MTLSLLGPLWAVAALAALVQGTVGIGFALIVAPVFALAAPGYLPVTLLILMLPLNAHVALRERGAIDWPGTGWITLGRFAGTFAGLALLLALSLRQMEIAVGLFTILAALVALFAPPFAPRRGTSIGVGLFTGISETATGIGGPPLALLYQHAPGPRLRATVAACFLIGEVLSLVVLALGGRVSRDHLLAAATLVPAVLLGSALSRHAHAHVPAAGLRSAVLAFSILAGAVLIV
ncbi:MAG: sulfite exporter TauE/SafE family protein [Paracoccus sp. (in: a-proteobacteria)]|uniref:sulfite exporter TauE/SafE family protein n=1 Tax=Paracoccus sp. TaxID=267 RepID=UPI0039E235B2